MEKERKKWKVCTDYFNNCEYIYPTQQRKVKQLIDYLKQNNNVISITVFGSSIESRCTNESDLDIYVVLKKDEKIINKYFNFVYDLWTNFTVENNMLDEISKKGMIVYEKR